MIRYSRFIRPYTDRLFEWVEVILSLLPTRPSTAAIEAVAANRLRRPDRPRMSLDDAVGAASAGETSPPPSCFVRPGHCNGRLRGRVRLIVVGQPALLSRPPSAVVLVATADQPVLSSTQPALVILEVLKWISTLTEKARLPLESLALPSFLLLTLP